MSSQPKTTYSILQPENVIILSPTQTSISGCQSSHDNESTQCTPPPPPYIQRMSMGMMHPSRAAMISKWQWECSNTPVLEPTAKDTTSPNIVQSNPFLSPIVQSSSKIESTSSESDDISEQLDAVGKKVTVDQMKIWLSRNESITVEDLGIGKIHQIGNHLFFKTKKTYWKVSGLTCEKLHKLLRGSLDSSVRSWVNNQMTKANRKFLQGDAVFKLAQKLGTTQFNDTLRYLIAFIQPLMAKLGSKKKAKQKQHELDTDNASIDTITSNSQRVRTFEELIGFTNYGVIYNGEPPNKKQKLNDNDDAKGSERCVFCKKILPVDGRYRCSKCKIAMYCGEECQGKHWSVHDAECTLNVKDERKSVSEWDWYAIIYWFNRVANGRFNNMEYITFRKHICMGRIKGKQLKKINHITLNMIGIREYTQHQMILNAIADLLMKDDYDNEAAHWFEKDVDIPETYLDPISFELMDEPVMIAKHHPRRGLTRCYERKCIEKYHAQYGRNPLTEGTEQKVRLHRKQNKKLRCKIQEWKQINMIKP
eukprot:558652_1